MNRRNFLKLLAPMPFIAPAIVTACGHPKPIAGGTLSFYIDGKRVDVVGDVKYTWRCLYYQAPVRNPMPFPKGIEERLLKSLTDSVS